MVTSAASEQNIGNAYHSNTQPPSGHAREIRQIPGRQGSNHPAHPLPLHEQLQRVHVGVATNAGAPTMPCVQAPDLGCQLIHGMVHDLCECADKVCWRITTERLDARLQVSL